jgi:hypothetical protein
MEEGIDINEFFDGYNTMILTLASLSNQLTPERSVTGIPVLSARSGVENRTAQAWRA